jgi:formylglycine-generating enzyme required for sulfatase activity
MNLTSQYIVNPKSRYAYSTSLVTYTSIRPSSAKLRLGDDRQVLNDKKKYKIFRLDNIEFKMIRCPIGMFTMGADDQTDNPKRWGVIENPFLLGETEVTQELFEKVMGFNPSGFQEYPNLKQSPVERVTWYDALMFCNRLSERCKKKPYYNISSVRYGQAEEGEEGEESENIEEAYVTINPQANGFRLPFEKEWEYAAKAGTNNQWAGTNDENKVGEVAWFDDNSEDETHPVKCKRPNEWGFYDMTGNVWEWCWDTYEEQSDHGVFRGGSCIHETMDLRSVVRGTSSLDTVINTIGFRISASLFN